MTELPLPARRLSDSVVALRPWRTTDLPDNLMQYQDPLIQEFSWTHATPYTEEDARAYFMAQEQGRLRGEHGGLCPH
ncbi:GNAT family N-acetyltransferase [Nocardioides astragali]|uniref:GNAT family N-acetyltransferase n=1 Tax=Nocardioides astragali TaxID=1776736 RepID=A0ABW2N907_9ACTN|nr:GNAT family N-acetyltransferase [Nocardioides astragali]